MRRPASTRSSTRPASKPVRCITTSRRASNSWPPRSSTPPGAGIEQLLRRFLATDRSGGRHRRSLDRPAGGGAGRRPARRLPHRADRHRVGERQPVGSRSLGARLQGLVHGDRGAAALRGLVRRRRGNGCARGDLADRGGADPVPDRRRSGRAARRQTRSRHCCAASAPHRVCGAAPRCTQRRDGYISRPISSTRTEWVSAPTAR